MNRVEIVPVKTGSWSKKLLMGGAIIALVLVIVLQLGLAVSEAAVPVVIWEEDFEGPTDMNDPGSDWECGDLNAADGLVYWGEVTNVTANHTPAGSDGAWCAKNGGQDYGYYRRYVNNMSAYATHTLDLSSKTSAAVSFWYKIVSQNPMDNGIFSVKDKESGTVQDWFLMGPTALGWTQFPFFDLTPYCGGEVELTWWWFSYTYTPVMEGMYFDDVLVVEGVPPETYIDSGPYGAIDYNNPTFTYHGTDDGDPSGLQYSYKLEGYDDWSIWSTSTSKSYTGLSEQSYTFKVKTKDGGGEEDPTPAERSFTVDMTDPAAPTGLSANPANWTNNNSFTVNWTNPADLTGIKAAYYKLDSPPSTGGDGTRVEGDDIQSISNITVSGNGSHNIYVWLEDAAGNKNHNNRAQTVLKYDATKPNVAISNPSDYSTVSGVVNVTATANDLSGINKVEFYIDGALKAIDYTASYFYSWNVSSLPTGSLHTVTAKAFDGAGNNKSDTHNVSINVPYQIKGSTTWYFAEGYTGSGFQEWLTLQNPNGAAANAVIEYSFRGGGGITQNKTIGANTRETISVNSVVGSNKEVSVKISSDQPIIAERPMYFNFSGMTGGHNVVGANSTNTTWYFAEGYTGSGFQEWLTLQNPNGAAANAVIEYSFRGGGGGITQNITIGANTRETVSVNSVVGSNKEVSVKITSNQPIIAERPMYFNFSGMTGGHNVVGANSTNTTWYFAEGYTGSGFQEWLTLQNPNGATANAVIEYSFRGGGGITQNKTIGANTRETISVNSVVGSNKEVSVKISSDQPIIAERPMYFNFSGMTGGHNVVGFRP